MFSADDYLHLALGARSTGLLDVGASCSVTDGGEPATGFATTATATLITYHDTTFNFTNVYVDTRQLLSFPNSICYLTINFTV